MEFSDVVRKTWEQNLLFSVLVELTYRCNLNCYFCYNDVGMRGQALNLEQHLALLDELAEMQVFQLVLTGGEPLAHPDFFTIGAHARERGFVVRLKSNGHAISPAIARRLRDEVDPFNIDVSLHGACAETHDRQTQVPGSFRKLITNLGHMRDAGLRVKINSTLTRWNEGEVTDMIALAAGLNMPIHLDPVVTPRDDGDSSPLAISPSAAGVENLLRVQRGGMQAVVDNAGADSSGEAAGAEGAAEAAPPTVTVGRETDEWMPKGQGKHCGAGSGGLAIDPYGNVYPCVQWRRPVGNLHEMTIGQIWAGSTALDEVREQNNEVAAHVSDLGAWGGGLNFCPGSAVHETGNHLGIYDSARRRADTVESLRDGKRELLPILR